MAFCWIFFMRFLMLDFGILRLVNLLIECLCIAPCTPAVIIMRGSVFHPPFCRFWINRSYLVCLRVRAWFGNLSWQYVNSISWIMSVGEGVVGVCVWFGAPIMQRTFGLSLAWHW